MNRFRLLSLILFVAGLIFFGLAGFSYRTLQRFYEIFSYYGVNEQQLLASNDDAAQTIFQLKFGIVKFLALGVVAWLVSIVLIIISRKKKLVTQ